MCEGLGETGRDIRQRCYRVWFFFETDEGERSFGQCLRWELATESSSESCDLSASVLVVVRKVEVA